MRCVEFFDRQGEKSCLKPIHPVVAQGEKQEPHYEYPVIDQGRPAQDVAYDFNRHLSFLPVSRDFANDSSWLSFE